MTKYNDLKITCCLISKEDLLKQEFFSTLFYGINEFDSIEEYLVFLEKEIGLAVKDFEKMLECTNIVIPQERFEKRDSYTFMF